MGTQKLNKVKQIRIALGMSNQDLADKSGLSKGAINLIENHKRTPNQMSILRISRALNVNSHEAFQLNWRKVKW